MNNISSNKEVRPFSLRDKIGYMFGDLGNDFTFIFASNFLLVFYTKVLGINGAIVGTLFLISRCIDAFTDVTMGRILDSSKPTKDGKFRPWLKRMCGPVALAGFLMFQSSLAGAAMHIKVIYMYITYILWGSVFYTSINIPYGSMVSAITDNPNERASLSTFRGIGATLAGLFIGTLTPLFIYTTDANGNQIIRGGSTFTIVAGVFSILAIISYIICYKLTTERIQIESKKSEVPFYKSLFVLLKNRSLIGIVGTALALVVAQLITGALSNYIFLDYYNNTSGLLIINFIVPIISIFLVSPISLKLSQKFGKKEIGVVSMLLGAISFIILYILKPQNMYLYIIVYLISYIFSMSVFNVVIWAAITDVIDDQEVKVKEREDGTIYAVYSFSRKIGQAIAGGLGGFILTIIKYDPLAVVQEPPVLDGLFTSMTLIPGIVMLIAVFMLQFVYKLNKKQLAINANILSERRK